MLRNPSGFRSVGWGVVSVDVEFVSNSDMARCGSKEVRPNQLHLSHLVEENTRK
jgi:hypothetical protein